MTTKPSTFPALPAQKDLEYLQTLPTHHPEELRHYIRRLDGIEGIAGRAATALAGAEGAFAVPGVTPASINAGLARIQKLEPIQQALYPYYRRAYENRLEADGDTMSAIYKIWRMAQASGDRGLIDRFQFIGDWIARHHAHGSQPEAPAPTNGAGASATQ